MFAFGGPSCTALDPPGGPGALWTLETKFTPLFTVSKALSPPEPGGPCKVGCHCQANGKPRPARPDQCLCQ